MAAVSNVVAIHGVPRSGTSWLGQLFNSSPRVAYRYQPFFSYAFRGRIDEDSSPVDVQAFFSDLLASNDPFVLQTGSARMAEKAPAFDKKDATHLVYKEVRFHSLLPHLMSVSPPMRVIGIVRDPRSVLASWARAPREFDPSWELKSEWRNAMKKNAGLEENWFGFERWKDFANLMLSLESQYPSRVRLIRYEDLVAAPLDELASLMSFCNLELDNQSLQFVKDSTSQDDGDTYGVFRRRALGSPAPNLSPDIGRMIVEELRSTPLFQFLAK